MGYVGVFLIDGDADVIRGKFVNTRDTITFQGQTVVEAVQALHDSVDDYLAWCQSEGEAPEKPFSGKLLVRLRPEDDRALNAVAQIKGARVNTLVSGALRKVIRRAGGSEFVGPGGATAAEGRPEKTSGSSGATHKRPTTPTGQAAPSARGRNPRRTKPTASTE